MVVALLLILLFAALIGASLLAARYHDPASPPENAKAEDRALDDHVGHPSR